MTNSLQERLDASADEIFADRNAANFLALHLVCGNLGRHGATRRTAIRCRNNLFSGFADSLVEGAAEDVHNKKNRLHRNVVLNHIRHLNREDTFLSHIVDICDRVKNRERYLFQLEATTLKDQPYESRVTTDGGYCYQRKWTISNSAKFLPDISEQFLEAVYKTTHDPRTSREQQHLVLDEFPRHLAYAQARIFAAKSSFPDENAPIIWDEVRALQSVLLFAGLAGYDRTQRKFSNRIASVFVERIKVSPGGDYGYLVLIFSPGLEPCLSDRGNCHCPECFVWQRLQDEKLSGEEVFTVKNAEKMRTYLWDIEQTEKMLITHDTKAIKASSQFDSFRNSLAGSGYVLDSLNVRAQILLPWVLFCLGKLHGKRHEGKVIPFYFVIGDLDEFADNRYTDTTKELPDMSGRYKLDYYPDSDLSTITSEHLDDTLRSFVRELSSLEFCGFCTVFC